jgi:hypothetical protein
MNRAWEVGVALALVAAPAQAANGLHLAWGTCANTTGAMRSVDLSCDSTSGVVYSLVGTFGLAGTMSHPIAMDGVLDFTFIGSADVPPFWQFQMGGCNEAFAFNGVEGGPILLSSRPTSCDRLTNSSTFCGTGGLRCTPFITDYFIGAAASLPPNRARMTIVLAGSDLSVPPDLNATSSTSAHFAFQLQFFMDHAPNAAGGGCAGCYTGVSVVWSEATFYNTFSPTQPEAVAGHLTRDDPGSTDAEVLANPAVVAAKPSTWGRLKSLYR